MLIRFLTAWAISASMTLSASPVWSETAYRYACTVPARVVDPDTNGTNVRAKPGGRIVTRIPRERRVGEEAFAPELQIVGFARGWARVRSIRFADYGGGDIPLFSRPGWIPGSHLSADLSGPLLTAPSDAANTVTDLPPDPGLAAVITIDDCSGDFAHVIVRLSDGRRVAGWTASLCANQVTTCA